MENSSELSLFEIAKAFVLHTNRHIFLTGRAGTGKTTFLKYIKEHTSKNVVILAPTGVAAINAGGVTIHSFFQLQLGSFIPVRQRGFSNAPAIGTDLQTLLKNIRFNKEKRRLLEELELLVIDEVSMVRADMIDAMDGVLRHFRKNPNQPFGGVQVLYIGDLFQLPPVVKDEEWSVMSQYYKSMFFFDALVMSETKTINIELDKIYRQSDEHFIALLNAIRNNIATDDDLRLLNKYYDPYFYPDPEQGYIILTSHNYKADKINQSALAKLNNEAHNFEGTLTGDFNEHALPVDKQLTLKEGAQIMFIKNDKGEQRRYYNGKIGTVSRIKSTEIFIRFPGEREELLLEQETWRNIRYQYNEAADQIVEEELGSYKQYPIRLAWAVTIHKSQGLTFEKAIIDAGQSFAPGQVYVALSRLTSLSGLVLSSQITPTAIHTESRITNFSAMKQDRQNLLEALQIAQKEYITERLLKSFTWEKVLEHFREHHDAYSTIKIPNQADAIQWSAATIQSVIKLKDVGDKFLNQLKQLIEQGDRDGYTALSERLKAAASYFEKEINDNLLQPWQKHFDETKVKAKTKKYLRTLQPLYTLIIRKRQQVEQAMTLANGMAQGKNITHLLEHYQNTHKHIPHLPDPNIIAGAVKEDTRSLSLEMYQQGKSIDEIAKERGLVKGTIEGHLLSFIITGEVKLEQIVPKEKQAVIQQAIKRSPDKNITSIREVTGNACSYNEIKAVLTYLEKEEKV
ncbi:MAG TPA: helix-turn-helix domain-containing protein [Flavipsychrobacter sp.]|nr:helix-turn-helix domain-containing protein [Flavipsychrobacter sp.]